MHIWVCSTATPGYEHCCHSLRIAVRMADFQTRPNRCCEDDEDVDDDDGRLRVRADLRNSWEIWGSWSLRPN